MIPKVIHYCWFGGKELPELAKRCIASWKKYCPDYRIIRWDEENFDVFANDYTRWCYENRKWAFLSDYARLAIVAEQGGFYFDTDVELLSGLDPLLEHPAFFSTESPGMVNTGQGFGAEAHHPAVLAMYQVYDDLAPTLDGAYPTIPCPQLNTQVLKSLGFRESTDLQNLDGALILPPEYMNPLDNATGRLNITNRTISIHHYAKSWISPGIRLRTKLTRPLHRIFGKDCLAWLRKRL